MKHQFKKVEIPEGCKSVRETCKNCGQQSLRYASHARLYQRSNGQWSIEREEECPGCGAKGLTTRQMEILQAAADGLSCRQTADLVGGSLKMIQVLRFNMIQKMNAPNIAAAVAMGFRENLLK